MSLNNTHPYDFGVVSPNGALDSYYVVSNLLLNDVNRASEAFHTAGGKGHNLARAGVRLGGRVLSIGIVGGHSGRFIEKDLAEEGIDHELVWADIETRRCNTILIEGQPDTTVILEPGQSVGDMARSALSQRVLDRISDLPYLILTGSLPPDFPESYYADLIKALPCKDTQICIDSNAEPLRLAAIEGAHLIKVNRNEFLAAFGDSSVVFSRHLAEDVYLNLKNFGLQTLIVTDGASGAYVFATDCEPFRVATAVETLESTAGAGDTFLAGFVLALQRGKKISEAARYASAAAAANLQQLGCGFLNVADVDPYLGKTTISAWVED